MCSSAIYNSSASLSEHTEPRSPSSSTASRQPAAKPVSKPIYPGKHPLQRPAARPKAPPKAPAPSMASDVLVMELSRIQNQLRDKEIEMEKLRTENKTLNRMQQRQEKALTGSDRQQNDVTKIIQHYTEENKALALQVIHI